VTDDGAPRLLGPGEGEDISGRLWIKCDLEPLAFTDTVGSSSTNPHVHETHVDGFWVLERGFTVGVGDEEITLEPGDFALVPPGLVHYFKATDSRWLNLHAPNAGFAEYLRSGADFDNRDASEGDNRRVADGILRRGDEGELIELGPNARGRVKVGADDAIGSVTVIDFELAPESAGPPLHLHERITDSFWVLEGTLTVLMDGEEREAAAGSHVVVPPGNVHSVSNPSAEPVRFLNISTPGGLERYLRELAADPSDFAAIAARHDVIPA
jgi:mannose-6-phosphate isomerase-like protein (cupin superfamily)